MPRGTYVRKTTEELFWAKVDKSGECWLWKAARTGSNREYGHFHVNRLGVLAHRYSYELAFGFIPPDKVVRHKCDTGHCVNPAHLILGSQKDNIHDAVGKSRHCHGETHGMVLLKEKDVLEILASVEKRRVLAAKYEVSLSTINDIKSRRSWKHL